MEHVDGSVLTSVQMFIRHGDRTPTKAIPADANVTWDCESLGSFIYTANTRSLGNTNSTEGHLGNPNAIARQVIVTPEKSPFASFNWKGSCIPGQLTPVGAQQHRTLGGILREIYVERWKLLASEFDASQVYVRSTDYWRTQQSAESLISGLFSPQISDGRPPVFELQVVPKEVDYMTINMGRCPKAKKILKAITKSDGFRQVLENTKSFYTEASEILPDIKLLDSVLPRVCNNKEPYCEEGQPDNCITAEMADLIAAKVSLETAEKYRDAKQSRKLLRLGMGPLAADILDNFSKAQSTTQKFKLYSGHDTTLTPLLGLLESTDMRWPPYAANLILELWTDPQGEQFVRVFQNGKVMDTTTNWCTLEWCPLAQFKKNLEKYIPSNIVEEC
ncbi:hypothetical protein BGZ94_010133, partial [Podila epigama]